jgi:hypothetical protein
VVFIMLRTKFLFCSFVSPVALSFALLTGCGSGNNTVSASTTSPAAFSVTSITPAAGTTQVSASATIQITFSSAADASAVNTTNIQVTDPKAVAGEVAYNATANSATFTPSAALVPDTTYTVTVTGVTSSAGTAMSGPFTSTFATIASSATTQYQATLYSQTATIIIGQVTVDTSGNVNVQLTGAAASTTFTVLFWPAWDAGDLATNYVCLNVGAVSTNAAGSGTSTAKFPNPGSWAGDFWIYSEPTGIIEYGTTLWAGLPGSSSQVYMSTLQPETTVNGTGVTPKSPQAPLTSGTVTYANGSIEFAVTGAYPDTTYNTIESQTTALEGSGSYGMSTFTTNSSGDGSSTASYGAGYGDLFQVEALSGSGYIIGAGYIGGFLVPK